MCYANLNRYEYVNKKLKSKIPHIFMCIGGGWYEALDIKAIVNNFPVRKKGFLCVFTLSTHTVST